MPNLNDSPLSRAEDAKHARNLGTEINILSAADADLNAQTWLPLVAGDVVLMAFDDQPDLAETYLAEPDDSAEGAALRQISSHYEIHEGTPPLPFYDLWFEAGPGALTVIRAGVVVFGNPRRAEA